MNSDGIPITDEYEEDERGEEVAEQQYHWNADIPPRAEGKDDDDDQSSECGVEGEEEEDDGDEAELLPPLSPAPAALAAMAMANDISTGYPDEEELPEEFAEAKVRFFYNLLFSNKVAAALVTKKKVTSSW